MPFAQVRIIGHVPVAPVNPDHLRWLAVMTHKGIVAHDLDALAPLSAKLASFTDFEMAHILDGLLHLRDKLPDESGQHRFLVSAKYLLASSKLLDVLPALALRAFGISVDDFPNHPLYVVVAGCSNPEAVILVENPAAFELAVRTQAIRKCAFIATFGFGLSKSQEDYGNQLAFMAEERFANAITLTREGTSCPSARELLNHPMITFWGDLDVAGIQIFERLANKIPQIRLSALYTPMIEAINNPHSRHPYVSAVGKSGQKEKYFGQALRQDAKFIRAYCELWAVDQEIVSGHDIEKLAGSVLESK
jgi:hypothetical protein